MGYQLASWDIVVLPSGKHTKSYWKWWLSIVDSPIDSMVIVHSYVIVYQRVVKHDFVPKAPQKNVARIFQPWPEGRVYFIDSCLSKKNQPRNHGKSQQVNLRFPCPNRQIVSFHLGKLDILRSQLGIWLRNPPPKKNREVSLHRFPTIVHWEFISRGFHICYRGFHDAWTPKRI